ncbi:MAG TPA: hypothetical protein VM124_02195 [Candidatus Limnocylindrales bacterium]|nr:hypothetical protein [Candidatus Limnocylindrales bacterium]
MNEGYLGKRIAVHIAERAKAESIHQHLSALLAQYGVHAHPNSEDDYRQVTDIPYTDDWTVDVEEMVGELEPSDEYQPDAKYLDRPILVSLWYGKSEDDPVLQIAAGFNGAYNLTDHKTLDADELHGFRLDVVAVIVPRANIAGQ